MLLSVAGCAFCDWPVGIGPPSLKYSNTLHAKFGVSTSGIIIDSAYLNHCLLLYICRVYLLNPQDQQFCILYCVVYLNGCLDLHICLDGRGAF